jgi:hypothetical protein
MSFSCDCSNDGGTPPELYNEEYPTARKEHKCCECGGVIKPGQKYHKAKGMWEGEFRTYKTCMPCNNIREHYCSYGFVFTELAEQIMNCLEFDYRKVL